MFGVPRKKRGMASQQGNHQPAKTGGELLFVSQILSKWNKYSNSNRNWNAETLFWKLKLASLTRWSGDQTGDVLNGECFSFGTGTPTGAENIFHQYAKSPSGDSAEK